MTQATDKPVYRALAMLENECIPLLRRREPYWRPRPTPVSRECHTPSWGWVHPLYSDDLRMDLTHIDRNAAFISAISSAGFAHGALERTGALRGMAKAPGYYRIDAHHWNEENIVSPLGSAKLEGKVWVPQPTVELLQQLTESGHWPGADIYDSWTCPDSVRFRSWATAVNNDRIAALTRVTDDPDHDPAYDSGKCGCDGCVWYDTVKNGYSMAVQLFLGPKEGAEVKSGVKRPDWYHTVHAQHAATTWRYIWKCYQGGITPVMMGSTDEVTWMTGDFLYLRDLPEPLLKMDQSGALLGHWKVKLREIAGEEVPLA